MTGNGSWGERPNRPHVTNPGEMSKCANGEKGNSILLTSGSRFPLCWGLGTGDWQLIQGEKGETGAGSGLRVAKDARRAD